MSSKSVGNAFQQFVDKLKSSNIVRKQNEVHEMLSGPLGLCKDKISILESDEAISVLTRIDADYNADLKRNVEGIFYEEHGKSEELINELDSCLIELQVLLDGILQRIQNENPKCPDLMFVLSLYEDARSVLVFLKLKTNLLRLQVSVPLDEPLKVVDFDSEHSIEYGDFLLRLSKLEVGTSLLNF